jgi:lipid IVA palmitoyltransferase
MRARCFILFLSLCFVTNASALSKAHQHSIDSFWEQTKARIFQIWYEGRGDLYVTNYAWHNRWTYNAEKLSNYNELAWGGGIGKSIWDEHRNWQGLYAIAFLDSHKNVQPMGGYGYLFTLHPTENTGIGLGFTLMVTARTDILNNMPFPGALPLLSLNYKDWMIMGAYVPGTNNVGNVLFILTKITLG